MYFYRWAFKNHEQKLAFDSHKSSLGLSPWGCGWCRKNVKVSKITARCLGQVPLLKSEFQNGSCKLKSGVEFQIPHFTELIGHPYRLALISTPFKTEGTLHIVTVFIQVTYKLQYVPPVLQIQSNVLLALIPIMLSYKAY